MLMGAVSRDSDFPELLSNIGWRQVGEQYGLSARELSVLRLICRGMRNEAVACQLGIRPPTLRTHLRSIYQKLACDGRTQALLRVIHGSRRHHP
jgi:DNA-binding CsgD family transcriptional regulator